MRYFMTALLFSASTSVLSLLRLQSAWAHDWMRAVAATLAVALAISVAPVYAAVAQQPAPCLPLFTNETACSLEILSWVQVRLQGSHLSRSGPDLERLVRLRVRNDLSFLRHETLPVAEVLNTHGDNTAEIRRRGHVDCFVWTIGEREYPIALYVECKIASFISGVLPIQPAQILGLSNRELLGVQVEEALRQAVQKLAANLFEARDVMTSAPPPAGSTTPAINAPPAPVQRRG